MDELKTCPICGGRIKTQLTDEEGNFRDKDYLNDPYSGISYALVHPESKKIDCPIALGDDEQMGLYIYDTEEEAIEAWNRRADNAEPVVHAHWNKPYWGGSKQECSNCHCTADLSKQGRAYCSYCGAKMDEEVKK